MIATGVRCDVGLRENLEDGALAAEYLLPADGRLVHLTACDGVGGNLGGEVASALALAHVHGAIAASLIGGQHLLGDGDSEALAGLLGDTLRTANQLVLDQAAMHPELSGMASTVVSAVVFADRLIVAWAGDSRGYLLSGGHLRRLTHDHSRVQELLDTGELSPAVALSHPEAHTITRYLGQPKGFVPELRHCPIGTGDAVLLCTDGVSDVLEDRDLERLMNDAIRTTSVYRLLPDVLIGEALAAGATDNLTVLCYRHGALDPLAVALGRTSTGAYPVVAARTLQALNQELQDD